MKLGEKIKQARKESNVTQVQLAEELGVMQKDVSRWENNLHIPNAIYFIKLAIITGKSIEWFNEDLEH